MNNQTLWMMITGIIAISAIAGLDVMFLTAEATREAQIVEDTDPCRLITCGPGKIRAEPIGTDSLTGNTICKCPNRADYYNPLYQVSATRKY